MLPPRFRLAAAFTCLLGLPIIAQAQFPTPTYGWNLGDTMEAPSVGAWNPAPTQALINAVAAAGFNTIRIPCAWDMNADQTTGQINPTFMAQVRQLVDWCLAAHLTVVINDHWDDGWFEDSDFTTYNSAINAKLMSYWTQIATTFASYDNRLLFACANEPNASTAAQTAVLFQYYQNFINTVRATGGQNTARWLVLQGPQTNIANTVAWGTSLPSDPTPNRLVLEVHYYDPYNYTMMTADQSWGDMAYFWGSGYHSSALPQRNPTWGEEANWMQPTLQQMYANFTSKGIPVMIGEFAAMDRTGNPDLTGSLLTLHLASRTYFDQSVLHFAAMYGLAPFYWDTGIFNRTTNAIADPAGARALTGGVPELPEGSPAPLENVALGGTAAFTATVTPGATYQWQLNGIAISSATDPVLFLTNVTAANAGTYQCVATSNSGTVTTVAGMLTVSSGSPGYLVNLSSRAQVSATAADDLTVGFYTIGQPKSYLLRGPGPSLANFQVSAVLADPLLTVYDMSQNPPAVLSANAGWESGGTQTTATLQQTFTAVGAFALSSPADTALLQSLGAPGAGAAGYSAVVSSPGGSSGVAMAEIYDADLAAAPGQRLINVSSRGQAGTGQDLLIDGFVIDGTNAETVLIRGVGPTLAADFGLTGVLAQPQITLYQGQNALATNAGWNGDATLASVFSRVGAFALPTNSADAALLVTLPPGSYTAIVTGANNSTGVALAEVYEVR